MKLLEDRLKSYSKYTYLDFNKENLAIEIDNPLLLNTLRQVSDSKISSFLQALRL